MSVSLRATFHPATDQDVHLDTLSRSITRQRDLSMQINDELDVHTGLLEELDHDLDNTGNRLNRAGQRLGRVAKGAKEHGEWRLLGDYIWLTEEFRVGTDDCIADTCSVNFDYRFQDMMIHDD